MRGHPVFGVTGQAVLVPGTHRTSSYLCVADDGAARSLHSACHGTGTLVTELAQRRLSGPDPEGRITWEFGYRRDQGRPVPQLDDRGVRTGVDVLANARIVRPVARMRPFAVLH